MSGLTGKLHKACVPALHKGLLPEPYRMVGRRRRVIVVGVVVRQGSDSLKDLGNPIKSKVVSDWGL
jgi:hypothetical protein